MHKQMRDINLNADMLLGDYQELLLDYFRMFGNKKCCANDLKMFLNYLDANRRSELAPKLIQDTGITSTTLPQDVSTLHHVCHQLKFSFTSVERPTSKTHLLTSNLTFMWSSLIVVSGPSASHLLSLEPSL
jgi:hypothetical protein